MSATEHLANLKITILELIDDLRNHIFTRASEQTDLIIIDLFFKNMKEKDIMDHCIEHILPRKEEIEKKNIDFFIKNKNSIFNSLPQQRIDHFEKMIVTPESQGGMSNENRDTMWMYFQTISRITENYKKKQ